MRIISYFLVLLIPGACAAQDTAIQMHLWPNGAPGYESRRDIPEVAKDYYVKNIHNPSIVAYLPPREKATGAAVVICPGGGHRLLVYNSEGRDAARWFNSHGVAAFILKYRLFREDSTYSLEKEVRQDAYRAMRLVRSRAKEWGVDTSRVGIVGFSAGGETVAMVAYGSGKGDASAADPIDRLNGKPNFQILVYPGPLGIPAVVPGDAPPAFLIAANDDECCSVPVVSLLERYRVAKVPVEAHILSQGGHGFNMGYRSNLQSVKGWPQRLADWLVDTHIIKNPE